MNIIIPLAGRDPRYTTFKPFIPFRGEPLIRHIVDQHTILPDDKLIFILLKQHETHYGISKKLTNMFGENIIIRILSEETKGAPCSILEATRDLIDNDQPILIELADVLRDLKPFYKDISHVPDEIAGIIPIQQNITISDRPWGYVLLDEQGNAARLEEKQTISTPAHATMGLYYFSKGSEFIAATEAMIQKNSFVYHGNYFVGPVYNELIAAGQTVKTSAVKIHYLLGGPTGDTISATTPRTDIM